MFKFIYDKAKSIISDDSMILFKELYALMFIIGEVARDFNDGLLMKPGFTSNSIATVGYVVVLTHYNLPWAITKTIKRNDKHFHFLMQI